MNTGLLWLNNWTGTRNKRWWCQELLFRLRQRSPCHWCLIFVLLGLHLRVFPTCSWLFTWIFYGLLPGVCSLNPSSMLWQTSNSSKGLGPCCYCNPNGCTSLSGSVLRRGPGSTKARNSDGGGGGGVMWWFFCFWGHNSVSSHCGDLPSLWGQNRGPHYVNY